jgi:very-short-patch-repair endonuclease
MRDRGTRGSITGMSIEQILTRLGGVATRRMLIQATSRREFDRARRTGAIVRDAQGRYALPATHDAVRAAHALAGVLSHRSAALRHGWEVKTVPACPDVTVRRNRTVPPERRAGICLHRADLTPADLAPDGISTSVVRTLVDCMRSYPFDEALAVADSALRHRSVTKGRLIELADAIRGPGAPQARRVAREASAEAANPFESALRGTGYGIPGLHLEPQVVIADRDGRGRADLVDRKLRLVVEAESHTWHSRRGALRRDCRRYTKLTLLGWRVLRFAWEDVMFHPDYVRECLEAAVGLVDRRAGSASSDDAAA